MKAPALAVLALWILTSHQSGQAPTFRSSTDAVLVHVLVRQGSRSVSDLGCDDFELRDNGVVQALADCSYDAMPLDVGIVSDISQSVRGPILDRELQSRYQLVKLLQPIDRVRTIGFASALQTWPVELPLLIQDGIDRGHTALTDAIASALMLPADPGRRRGLSCLRTVLTATARSRRKSSRASSIAQTRFSTFLPSRRTAPGG
jgi:hypothetical protein